MIFRMMSTTELVTQETSTSSSDQDNSFPSNPNHVPNHALQEAWPFHHPT